MNAIITSKPGVILSRKDGEGPSPGGDQEKVLRFAQDDTGHQ
jgi:hypothetical protein